MKIATIATPGQLQAALSAKKISHGEAMLVLLHRIDPTTVAAWVAALTPRIRADFEEYARARVASSDPTNYSTGRGLSLPEAPKIDESLRTWLGDRDRT